MLYYIKNNLKMYYAFSYGDFGLIFKFDLKLKKLHKIFKNIFWKT